MKGSLCNRKVFMLILAVSVILLGSVAFAFTFTGKGCNGNQICDSQTDCDLSGNCNTQYSNCVSCGTSSTSCSGGIASCANKCDQSGTTAECKTCTPDCSNPQIRITDPHVIIKFSVFTKKNFITDVTPRTQTALAGKSLSYKATIENKHPKAVLLRFAVEVPEGWSSTVAQELQMAANSKRDVSFTVTSNVTTSDGSYVITFVAFSQELAIFDRASVGYVVASRGAPTIIVEPSTQEGAPGETLDYSITVTNNDPEGFDASPVTIAAFVPNRWSARFDKSSIKLNPGESGNVILSVTSDEKAEIDSYTVNLNATANQLSASGFAEYRLTFCGNGICEVDENCAEDCLQETDITCNGRCEQEVDDGVEFSGNVNFMFTRFLACSRNSKPADCLSAYEKGNCGYGKPCLCGSSLSPLCLMRCVDNKGAYYLYAKDGVTARTNSNYSYACPFVNLPEFTQVKNNFSIAKSKYEQARSAFNETMKLNISERKKLQPCVDALNSIIKNLTAHVSYMEDVINSPAKSNTTKARRLSDEIRSYIEVAYNKYCRGEEGLLHIESLTPPVLTEKGTTATADVVVKNLANFDYYGYAECDFLPPGGQKIVARGECTPFAPSGENTFSLSINASYDGEWKVKCRVYASLESDCSTEIHDETDYVTFDVYSKEIYVVDVSGQCRTNDVLCSVRTSTSNQCVGCNIDGTECTILSRNETTTYFSCPKKGFYSKLNGYVYSSQTCIPTNPFEKNITVHCSGCGDNVTEGSEQCELPNTDNSIKCLQTEWMCDGKRYLYRDKYGFCAPSCQCSPDQYKSVCSKNVCNANCSDGETRNKTITNSIGACKCIQDCNSACEWTDCYCEPVPLPDIEILDAAVSDSCPEERAYIDVWCTSSLANQECVKAKIGSNECSWSSSSYWYGNAAVFTNCAVGSKTNTTCGAGSKNVVCYVDKTICNQVGENKTTGIDVRSTATPPQQCITNASCSGTNDKCYCSNNICQQCPTGDVCQNHACVTPTVQCTTNTSCSGTNNNCYCLNGACQSCPSGTICENHKCVTSAQETKPTVEILGAAVSETCPEEKTYIDVICSSSIAKTDCIKAKVGNSECLFGNNSYWYGNDAVFTDCAAGLKTSSVCGDGSRSVVCYVDKAKCDQKGANKTVGIDVMTAVKVMPVGACSIKINSKNCSYDRIANRYNVYLDASWSGGSYVKAEIDDIESNKYTIQKFTYSKTLSAAGTKQITASVFNNNDIVLCMNATSVYCTPEQVGPSITNVSVELLGISVSDSCPVEKTSIDVECSVSVPRVECIRAKIGSTVCEWNNNSYWYGSSAVFKDCAAGTKTNSVCGNQSREVRCYIDKTKCIQTGGDKTLGIDVSAASKTTQTTSCSVQLTSQSCAYDPVAKRYTAALGVKWANGDHAHGKIGSQDTGSVKYTASEFVYTKQFGTPGSMNLQAYVHDSADRVICSNSSTIYCGAGNTTGKTIDVIRHMPDVSKPGWIDVSFDIIAYRMVQNFELREYVEKNLIVANRTIEGNISQTIFAGPSTVSEGSKDYNVYSWRTDVDENQKATISYKVMIDKEGEYHFIAKAKYFDEEKQYSADIFVTECQQTTPVFAKSPTTGTCTQFPTACEAAKLGYIMVESCVEPPTPTPQPEQGFDWIALIIVIIIAVILVIAWVKREEIKEKIYEWRHGREEKIISRLR